MNVKSLPNAWAGISLGFLKDFENHISANGDVFGENSLHQNVWYRSYQSCMLIFSLFWLVALGYAYSYWLELHTRLPDIQYLKAALHDTYKYDPLRCRNYIVAVKMVCRLHDVDQFISVIRLGTFTSLSFQKSS